MRKFSLNLIVFSIIAVLTTSCLHAAPDKTEIILGLSAPLTKLTAAVDSAVLNKGVNPDFTDKALLDFATAHDPSLLLPFKGYTLKARQVGSDSSVLVCDKLGQTALIEDSGCTAKSDKHFTPGRPCAYVLNLAEICALP